jgi:hypothetical protein
MDTNLSFDNDHFPVRLDSFGTGAQPDNPPAGVHPVVAKQGKWTSFLSSHALPIGVTVSLDSGFPDMPYRVRVQSCAPTQGGYYIAGIIGG